MDQGNLCVGPGDAASQAVDIADCHTEFAACGLADAAHALRSGTETRRHLVDAGQSDGARARVGGCVGHVGKRVKHVAHGSAKAARAALEQVFQLLQALQPLCVRGSNGTTQRGLTRQELVVVAQHGCHFHTVAVITRASGLALDRLQHHRLARIPGRVDIGNVVAGGLQRQLIGQQRAGSYIEDAGHVCSFKPGRAAGAASG